MLGPLFPVVHNNLRCRDLVEGEVVVLAPHGQVSDLLPIGCDQAYHCCVIGKCNDGVVVSLVSLTVKTIILSNQFSIIIIT